MWGDKLITQRIDECNTLAQNKLVLMSNTLMSSSSQSSRCMSLFFFFKTNNRWTLFQIRGTNSNNIIVNNHWRINEAKMSTQGTGRTNTVHKTHICTRSRTKDSFKDANKPTRGLLAEGLRGICWTARDCVIAAPPPPVSCVCAGTGWREGRGGEEDLYRGTVST